MMFMQKSTTLFLQCFLGTALTFGLIGTAAFIYNKCMTKIKFLEDRLIEHQNKAAFAVGGSAASQEQPDLCAERVVVTSGQLWRPVQDMVQDTVVQVFSHISGFDILRPYAQPTQGAGAGSGFFISKEGYLITNAHVVDQAHAMWIQIPSLGKEILDVELIGVSPERDIALLQVTPEARSKIEAVLGEIPFLILGDSNNVYRSDEVMVLGYPLGQQSLKSTTGIVSGREQHMIQTSAAINPGNSGGPLVNMHGEVIGINTAIIRDAQNVGYALPINTLKLVLPDLFKVKLLRKPFLGIIPSSATEAMIEYLGNPPPGGCYVVEVVPDSNMDRAGIKRGDMIYEINGMQVDRFGEMVVPWSEDKLSIFELVNFLTIGDVLNLVIYRYGKRIEANVQFDYTSAGAIKRVYPGLESIDYEIFGGIVVMELTKNHIAALKDVAGGLLKYGELRNQQEPVLIITQVFGNSQAHRSRLLFPGTVINEVNGIRVKTLADFRSAVQLAVNSKFLTLLVSDNIARSSDNIFVALPITALFEEEPRLSHLFRYETTPFTRELIAARQPLLSKDELVVHGA